MSILQNKLFYSWSECNLTTKDFVGGKGYNISLLYKYGFKVPAGVILSTVIQISF